MDFLKVIVKKPGHKPEICQIGKELQDLQAVVGGLIETVSVTPTIDIVVNEEGLILDLPLNVLLNGQPLHGTLFYVGVDACGEFVSLADDESERIMTMYERAFTLAHDISTRVTAKNPGWMQ